MQLMRRAYRALPLLRELVEIRDELGRLKGDVAAFKTSEHIQWADLELDGHPRYDDPRRLHRHAFQVNSRAGEDGMIHEIFRRIGVVDRTFVEIGVDEVKENNTAFLLAQGWKGYWTSGTAAVARSEPALRRAYGGALKHRAIVATSDNAAGVLEAFGVPAAFDLLSLGPGRQTYYLWDALRAYRPRVVVIPYNAAFPPDVEWKVRDEAATAWDGSQNFGASLKALERLGWSLGYRLVGCDFCGVHAFFVRDDQAGDRFARPYNAEHHYEPIRYAMANRRGYRPALLDVSTPEDLPAEQPLSAFETPSESFHSAA